MPNIWGYFEIIVLSKEVWHKYMVSRALLNFNSTISRHKIDSDNIKDCQRFNKRNDSVSNESSNETTVCETSFSGERD